MPRFSIAAEIDGRFVLDKSSLGWRVKGPLNTDYCDYSEFFHSKTEAVRYRDRALLFFRAGFFSGAKAAFRRVHSRGQVDLFAGVK